MKRKLRMLAVLSIITLCLQLFPIQAFAGSASSPIIGEIKIFAGNYAPQNWAFCNGQVLPIAQYQALYMLIGTTYGGDGITTFALPDLRGRVPIGIGQGPGLAHRILGEQAGVEGVTLTPSQMAAHNHNVDLKIGASGSGTLQGNNNSGNTPLPGNNLLSKGVRNEKIYSNNPLAVESKTRATNGSPSIDVNLPVQINSNVQATGGNQPHINMEPYLALNYIIALQGVFPSSDYMGSGDDYLGEIKMLSFNMESTNFKKCDGSVQSIAQKTPLFNLIGTTFGGNGVTEFALPDLRGRSPLGIGNNLVLGAAGGAEQVTLTSNQLPAHTHVVTEKSQLVNGNGSLNYASGNGNTPLPGNNVLAKGARNEKIYASGASGSNMKSADVELNLTVANPDITTPTGAVGASAAHENMMPYLAINFVICVEGGIWPPRDGGGTEDFIGAVGMFAFDYAPGGYALAQGQLFPIAQNAALFSILGNTFGGDGRTNFGLPNLMGRAPIGAGYAPGLSPRDLGESGGANTVTLLSSELPFHAHGLTVNSTVTGTGSIKCTNDSGNTILPGNNRLAKGSKNERIYSNKVPDLKQLNSVPLNVTVTVSPVDSSKNKLTTGSTLVAGGSQPHDNLKPFLGITFGVATTGIFPSRD